MGLLDNLVGFAVLLEGVDRQGLRLESVVLGSLVFEVVGRDVLGAPVCGALVDLELWGDLASSGVLEGVAFSSVFLWVWACGY